MGTSEGQVQVKGGPGTRKILGLASAWLERNCGQENGNRNKIVDDWRCSLSCSHLALFIAELPSCIFRQVTLLTQYHGTS